MSIDRKLYQSIIGIAVVTTLLLMIPLVAMQFTEEVVWSLSDFIFAGTMLFGTGLTYMLITRRSGEFTYRVAVGFALATGLFLVWSNLAVGIIGSESNPANLMYFGVIAVGITGAFISRFRPQGMVLALSVTASTQALVTIIALIAGMHLSSFSSLYEILGVNGFFIALWVGSALLFRSAARKQTIS